MQIVSEPFDGILYCILRAFADRSGLPLLGVAPFHLWRADLVTTARQVVLDFLVTSLDTLYLAGRIIEKVHGPTAVQNIARYKPRLAEEALVFESRGSCLIRIKRRYFLVSRVNSAITGWGFEDVDLQLRLQFALHLKSISVGEVVHLTHGDERRTVVSDSRWADHERNSGLCTENYRQSRFAGAYAADVARWQQRIQEQPGRQVTSPA